MHIFVGSMSNSKTIYYDFGRQRPENFNTVFQKLVPRLLDTTALQPMHVHNGGSDGTIELLDALRWLAERGFVNSSQVAERDTSWMFTDLGRKRLRLSQALLAEFPFTRTRAHVSIFEKHVFELLVLLKADRWVLMVEPKARRTKNTRRCC